MMKSQAQITRLLGQFTAQARIFGDWFARLNPTDVQTACALPGRKVCDVATLVDTMVADLSLANERGTTMRPSSLDSYLQSASIHRRPTEHAELDVCHRRLADRIHAHLADLDLVDPAQTPLIVDAEFGPLRFADYLRHRVLSVVTLCDDVSPCCTDVVPPRLDRQALISSVRTLAEVMAARLPGATVEVRVPGAIAVQIAGADGGSTHTRGTPPNVIECEPEVFLRLAMGRLTWENAVEYRLVTCSGVHAHLRHAIPIVTI